MTLACHSVEEFTPEALTDRLSKHSGWHDLQVSTVTAAPIGAGQMASNYRLELSYALRPESAPDTVIAKVASTDPASRQMGAATGAYQREVLFYQHLADLTTVRAPRCFHAEIAEDRCDFLLLLEDMGPARTVEQIGGCTPDQADIALAQAAALHGGSWRHTTVAQHDWLPVKHVWDALTAAVPQMTDPWLERFDAFLEPEHAAVVRRLGAEVPAWLTTLADHRTLWHGDFRLDNMLFDAHDGATPIAVLDWQSAAAAPGIIDVSYFLGNSLNVSDRAAHERTLVNEYHRRLLSHGVDNYGAELCWREYQAHALYGLILTIPISLGVESTERGDAMFGAMASRAAQQIVDNDSFAALAAVTR